jgi:hypothetical protein
MLARVEEAREREDGGPGSNVRGKEPYPHRDGPVAEILTAIERRGWDRLRPLLHPYVHWNTADGDVIRGRKRVMAHLASEPGSAAPSSYELRDGQVYRWTEDSA